MSIFNSRTRSDPTPSAYQESAFEFLDRAAGMRWQRVRDLINEWFDNYCSSEQQDLRSRLVKPRARDFRAAFWELYCHESLLRMGYDVRCHPTAGTKGRRPDFLAVNDGDDFILEATTTGSTPQQVTTDNLLSQVYDVLNRLNSPDFFVWCREHSVGSAPPRSAKLRRRLERWLTELDADAVSNAYAKTGIGFADHVLPRYGWQEDGWDIEFTAIPKKREARGKPNARPVGAHGPAEASFVDDVTPIRNALTAKANAYGNLECPYIVAIEADGFAVDDEDVDQALLGALQFEIEPYSLRAQPTRKLDGAWFGPRGPRNQEVSGVLISTETRPWTVARSTLTLWHNPYAKIPIRFGAVPWRQMIPDMSTRTMESQQPSIGVSSFFGLHDDWPNDSDTAAAERT